MGARVYDPYTGTFTQPDPIQGGGANAYGYTDGDPVNGTDLSGDAPCTECIATSDAQRCLLTHTRSFCDSGDSAGWNAYLQIVLAVVPGGGEEEAGAAVAEDGTRLLGPGTSIGEHVEGQLATRGWTQRLVRSTVDDPASTVATRDVRNLPGGGNMDDPATGYISRRGGYVVRNNRTGDVVQVSNRTDAGWRSPWDP
jgi:hypothetical protein